MIRSLASLALLVFLSACSSSPGGTADTIRFSDVPTLDVADGSGAEVVEDVLAVSPPFDWCDDAPPDEACFRERRDPGSAGIAKALAIARSQIERIPPSKVSWGWEDGVLMTGIVDLYRVTGDPELFDYVRDWIDHHLASGYFVTNSDTCPPAYAAFALWRETGSAKYRAVVDEILSYLYDVAPRTEDGGINHLGTTEVFGITLWVDSLFMFGETLIRLGEQDGDDRALDEFASQYSVFAKHLQEAPGLFKHAWQWALPQDEGIYWARGNGWISAAGYDYLRARAVRGETDEAVRESLARHTAAVVASQDPQTGLWWTVLNRPGETYLETSAAALFALGLARGWRAGLLGDDVLPVIRKAMEGVQSRIVPGTDGKPVVTGVSGPTTAGTFQTYATVKLEDDLTYGIGAVILALIETSGLPE